MGGLINPRPGCGQYRAGFSKTGGSPKPGKRAPCQKIIVPSQLPVQTVSSDLPRSFWKKLFLLVFFQTSLLSPVHTYKYPDSDQTLTQPRNTFASYSYEIWPENSVNYTGGKKVRLNPFSEEAYVQTFFVTKGQVAYILVPYHQAILTFVSTWMGDKLLS